MNTFEKVKIFFFTHRYFIKLLIVYFLTSLLVLCTFIIVFDRLFESISNNYIYKKEKEWAIKTGNSIEVMMGDYSSLLQDLAKNKGIQDFFLQKETDLEARSLIEQTINDYILFNKGFEEIHIIGIDISRRISSGYIPNIYLYRNWGILYNMTKDEQRNNFFFASRYRGINGEYTCLSVATKVFSPEGKLIAYIILDVYTSRITALLNQANPSQGNINLTDQNNYIQYSNSNQFEEGQIYQRPSEQDYNYHFEVPLIQDKFTFNYDIKNSYFKLLNRELGKMSFILLLLSMLISILIASFFSSNLQKPINKLINAMKIVGKGDLNVQLDLRKRNDLHELETEFNLLVRRFKNLNEENLESERLMHQAQISSLQAQIKPHFIYNILATLRGMVYYSSPDDVAELITNLTKLLRNTFDFSNKLKTLEWHLSIVQCYVDIQNKRFSDKFNLIIESDQKSLSCLMLPLLIQPIVENSISHGLEDKIGDCHISIQTWVKEDYLFIKIEDNGTGIDPETVRRINEGDTTFFQNHIGFGNVKKRLAYFYDQECYISLESKVGEGTTVKLKIQYFQN
ncbi:sensor histidine kinase [Oceanispirochaeta sp. M2]|uniref:sensor histidine kinase n=1 Tax=Oceanispirochaeta sp. M2 TaxID=2735869 RepID=UPI0015558CCE|nr:sensor histidine kinase [Oceanispirochaeta sp. M2]MBF9016736.1 histidine kinase [Oceanispirochaeta sp. M2]